MSEILSLNEMTKNLVEIEKKEEIFDDIADEIFNDIVGMSHI